MEVESSKKKPEKELSNLQEKTLIHQLEQNLLILEQDFASMLIKIQKGMNQLTNNNMQLSDLYRRSIDEYCDSIYALENTFTKIITNLEQLQDNFFQLDALSKKTGLFRSICEEKLKKIEKNFEIFALKKEKKQKELELEAKMEEKKREEEPKNIKEDSETVEKQEKGGLPEETKPREEEKAYEVRETGGQFEEMKTKEEVNLSEKNETGETKTAKGEEQDILENQSLEENPHSESK